MEKQDLGRQRYFKDLLIKLDKQYDNKNNYEFLNLFVSFVFNENNEIVINTGHTKSNRILFFFSSLAPRQRFVINFEILGVLFNHSFFIQLFNLIEYENYEVFSEKQLKNFLFYLYENKEINKIIIQNQYFNNTRLKKHNKDLFLNFLNVMMYRQNITDGDLFSELNSLFISKNKEPYKINGYSFNNNFYNIMKCKGNVIFNFLNRGIKKKYKESNFFNFDYTRFNDKYIYLNYGVFQDIFDFSNLFNILTEKIKKENLNRYEDFKNYKKNFKDLDQQEALQFFNFDDLKILVED